MIDGFIMFIVGAWASAVGFGLMPMPGRDPAAQQKFTERFGRLFRIIGPMLVVIGALLFAFDLI